MATITFRVDDAELWIEVFDSGWETWSWWNIVDFADPSLTTVDEVWVVVEDPTINPWALIAEFGVDCLEDVPVEERTCSTKITLDDIARAVSEHAICDYLDFDPFKLTLNLDAASGDCIVQRAVFGDLVYG